MKKLVCKVVAVMVALVMVMGLAPITARANAQNVTIIIDGRTVPQNAGTGFAQIVDGRTFVPLRLVSENMGIEVFWNRDGNQMVTLEGFGRTVYHTVGTLQAFDTPAPEHNVTQPVATTDVPSFIDAGRTMVGLRLISDSFGVTVNWTSATRTVTITTNAETPTPPATGAPAVRVRNIGGPRIVEMYPAPAFNVEDFYDIQQRYTDGTMSVLTNTGHVVRVGFGANTMTEAQEMFEGIGVLINIRTRVAANSDGSFGSEVMRNPAARLSQLPPGSTLRNDVENQVGDASIHIGGAIVEIVLEDGTNLGQFMLDEVGSVAIVLPMGTHRVVLVQAPEGFTLNRYDNDHRPIDSQGRTYYEFAMREGRFLRRVFELIAE